MDRDHHGLCLPALSARSFLKSTNPRPASRCVQSKPAEVEEWIGSKRRFCKAPLTYFNPRTARYELGKWSL